MLHRWTSIVRERRECLPPGLVVTQNCDDQHQGPHFRSGCIPAVLMQLSGGRLGHPKSS